VSALLAGLVCGLSLLGGQDLEGARQRLEAGDFAGALSALGEDPGAGPEHARLHAAILGEARDFRGGLGVLRPARARYPDDPELAWREANLLLWLQSGAAALEAVGELERALSVSDWSAEARASWEQNAAEFRRRGEEFAERERALIAAERRSRWVALGCLALAALALGWLARAPRLRAG